MSKPFIMLFLLAVAACAKLPEDIASTKPEAGYDRLSCRDARTHLLEERDNLAALSTEQTKIANTDKITSALLFVPVSALSGQDLEDEIAASKGRVEALEARLAGCA